MKSHSSCQQRHFVTPGRAIQRQGFQLRQTGLAVTEEAALRVVRASLHYDQKGASHNVLGWQTQHVAEEPQSALANSQYQVVHRHRCRCSVVLTGDGMQTAAVKTVDHAHHRLIGGKLSGSFEARYLAKERILDSLMSIFQQYILHKPVVHVCSEEFLRNVRHKGNVFCISLGQLSERLFRVFLGFLTCREILD